MDGVPYLNEIIDTGVAPPAFWGPLSQQADLGPEEEAECVPPDSHPISVIAIYCRETV
jgi:hypothetical protein